MLSLLRSKKKWCCPDRSQIFRFQPVQKEHLTPNLSVSVYSWCGKKMHVKNQTDTQQNKKCVLTLLQLPFPYYSMQAFLNAFCICLFPIHNPKSLFPICCTQLWQDLSKRCTCQLPALLSGVTCIFPLPIWVSALAVSIWRGDVWHDLCMLGPLAGGMCSWWWFLPSHFRIIVLRWIYLFTNTLFTFPFLQWSPYLHYIQIYCLQCFSCALDAWSLLSVICWAGYTQLLWLHFPNVQ